MPSNRHPWIASLALVVALTACGGAGTSRSTMAAEATSSPASSEPARPATSAQRGPDERGTANAFVVGPVRMELNQPFSVSADGEVRLGSELLGLLGPDGRLTRHGALVAELRAEGTVWLGGEDTGMRVEGTTLHAAEGPMMRIEDGQLIVGGQVEGERPEVIAIEGYRPELAREVLFLMGVYVAAMAAAYGHG